MESKVKYYVSIPLKGHQLTSAIQQVIGQASHLQWESSDKFHFTLIYLGDYNLNWSQEQKLADAISGFLKDYNLDTLICHSVEVGFGYHENYVRVNFLEANWEKIRQSLKDYLIRKCDFLDGKKMNVLPLHISLAKKNEKYTQNEKQKYQTALQGLKLAHEYKDMPHPELMRDGRSLKIFSQQTSPAEQLQTLVAKATFTPAVGNSMCSYKFVTTDDMQRAFNLMLQLEIITANKKRPEGYAIPLGKGEKQKLEDKMSSIPSPGSHLSY